MAADTQNGSEPHGSGKKMQKAPGRARDRSGNPFLRRSRKKDWSG
jgi:hypothetical protein